MLKRRPNYDLLLRISSKRRLIIIVDKVLLLIVYLFNITISITKFLMKLYYLNFTTYMLYYLYF
jgi:hypothetical protein